MVITRERRLSMLINDDEHAMLQALADADGLSASDFVRLTIRRLHGERFKVFFGLSQPIRKQPKKGKK